MTPIEVAEPSASAWNRTVDLLVAVVERVRAQLRSWPITSLGYALTVLTAATWVIAIRFHWVEFALAATGGLLLLIFGIPFLFRRGSFDVTLRAQPPRVSVGGDALGSAVVRNIGATRSFPQRVDLAVGAGAVRFDIPSIAAGASFEQPFVVPTNRRAIVTCGPATMVREDPLGLFRAATVAARSTQVYVHPRVARVSPVSVGWIHDVDGPTFDNNPRGDIAFHAIREYVPGDDMRHVHARSSARMNKLMVRQYVDNRRPRLVIVADDAAASYEDPEEFEVCMEIVASLEVACIRAGQDVLHHIGRRRRPRADLTAFLDDLAGVELTRSNHLLDAVRSALRVDGDATAAVVLSGSAASPHAVNRAARHLSAVMRTVVVRTNPRLGEPRLAKSARIVTMSVGSLEEFRRQWEVVSR